MLESLNNLDHELFVLLNGLHHPFWDKVMITASDKHFWIPFYAALLAFLIYLFRKRTYLLVPAIALTIGVADQVSSTFLKPWIARWRPCHDASLTQVINLVDGCGGKYGFVSSHAATSFGLAVLMAVALKPRYNWLKAVLFTWALVVSYSRIYLGAHFPGDILGGALVGSLSALGVGWLFHRLAARWFPHSPDFQED